MPEGIVILPDEPDLLAGGLDLPLGECCWIVVEPGGQRFRDCSESPVGSGGDGHRHFHARRHVPGDMPLLAAASSDSETGETLASGATAVRPSNQPKSQMSTGPYHVVPADGFVGKSEGSARCAGIVRRPSQRDFPSGTTLCVLRIRGRGIDLLSRITSPLLTGSLGKSPA